MLVLEASGVMSLTFHEQLEAGHGNVKDDATVPDQYLKRKRGTITDGLRAAAKLLKGAEEVKMVPQKGVVFRDYRKAGDYEKAIKDFYDSKPKNVRDFKMPNGIEGKVGEKGDRNIYLINKGRRGRPEIEIMRYRNNSETVGREFSGEAIKRITYD